VIVLSAYADALLATCTLSFDASLFS